MNCHQCESAVNHCLDSGRDWHALPSVVEHLARCPMCRAEVAAVEIATGTTLREPNVARGFAASVVAEFFESKPANSRQAAVAVNGRRRSTTIGPLRRRAVSSHILGWVAATAATVAIVCLAIYQVHNRLASTWASASDREAGLNIAADNKTAPDNVSPDNVSPHNPVPQLAKAALPGADSESPVAPANPIRPAVPSASNMPAVAGVAPLIDPELVQRWATVDTGPWVAPVAQGLSPLSNPAIAGLHLLINALPGERNRLQL